MFSHCTVTAIEDCAKDGGEEFFTEMHCVRITNLKDSIGIRLKNAMHLGKKILPAIFSAIVYCFDVLLSANHVITF